MYNLFDKTISVHRLVADSGESPSDIEEYTLVDDLGSVLCNIQPLDDSYGEDFAGSYGKDFLMFCDEYDIKEKDKIIEGDHKYIVVGVESYSFLGYSHMELRIKLTE